MGSRALQPWGNDPSGRHKCAPWEHLSLSQCPSPAGCSKGHNRAQLGLTMTVPNFSIALAHHAASQAHKQQNEQGCRTPKPQASTHAAPCIASPLAPPTKQQSLGDGGQQGLKDLSGPCTPKLADSGVPVPQDMGLGRAYLSEQSPYAHPLLFPTASRVEREAGWEQGSGTILAAPSMSWHPQGFHHSCATAARKPHLPSHNNSIEECY